MAMRLIDFVREKGIGIPKSFYYDTKKNLYDTLTVLPNYGRGLRVMTRYDGITVHPENYYIVEQFKPDLGLHLASGENPLQLERVCNGLITPHKGIHPDRFLCLPWRCMQNIEESKSTHETNFTQLTGSQSKEEFFHALKQQFMSTEK